MPGAAAVGRLAHAIRILDCEIEKPPQRFEPEVGLVTQYDGTVCQRRVASRPSGGALDGAEHSPFGDGVADAVC